MRMYLKRTMMTYWLVVWCIANIYGVVDTKTVICSRAEVHQNDKNTKVQQETRLRYSRERLMYFLRLYFCCKSTKVQKYKKYKINSGKDGPLICWQDNALSFGMSWGPCGPFLVSINFVAPTSLLSYLVLVPGTPQNLEALRYCR